MPVTINPAKINNARASVDAYRTAHTQLYKSGWYKGISEAHTPLLNTMLAGITKQGFASIGTLFTASNLYNIQQLGFADEADFEARATTADRTTLNGMWH